MCRTKLDAALTIAKYVRPLTASRINKVIIIFSKSTIVRKNHSVTHLNTTNHTQN